MPSRMPSGVQRGAPLSSALPEPRLCRQGDPPPRPSLTALPPFSLPFVRLIACDQTGGHNTQTDIEDRHAVDWLGTSPRL